MRFTTHQLTLLALVTSRSFLRTRPSVFPQSHQHSRRLCWVTRGARPVRVPPRGHIRPRDTQEWTQAETQTAHVRDLGHGHTQTPQGQRSRAHTDAPGPEQANGTGEQHGNPTCMGQPGRPAAARDAFAPSQAENRSACAPSSYSTRERQPSSPGPRQPPQRGHCGGQRARKEPLYPFPFLGGAASALPSVPQFPPLPGQACGLRCPRLPPPGP